MKDNSLETIDILIYLAKDIKRRELSLSSISKIKMTTVDIVIGADLLKGKTLDSYILPVAIPLSCKSQILEWYLKTHDIDDFWKPFVRMKYSKPISLEEVFG